MRLKSIITICCLHNLVNNCQLSAQEYLHCTNIFTDLRGLYKYVLSFVLSVFRWDRLLDPKQFFDASYNLSSDSYILYHASSPDAD